MKPITLSEDQKTKLLEMVKSLFPEYKHVSWDNQQLDLGSYLGWEEVNQFRISNHIFLSKLEESPFDDGIFVHWFEFVMTHLQHRIYLQLPTAFVGIDTWCNSLIGNLYAYFTDDRSLSHPIDYLYEQFKKLENGKEIKT